MWFSRYKKMIRSEISSKREYAAKVLGGYGNKKSVLLLIEVLKDNDNRVRLAAVKSLAELGDRIAVNPLTQILCDTLSKNFSRAII